MKFIEQIKKAFFTLNVTQQIAIGVLVLSVPLSIALGVSAFNNALGASAEGASSLQESSSTVSSAVVPSILEESSSAFSSSTPVSSKAPIVVTLMPSSVEEDLEVQIVDKNGKLVVGPVFKMTVKGKKNDFNKTWDVNDGFLKLKKIESGDYTVSVLDVEGCIIPQKSVDCYVNEKVKYEKVDVSDKIKDETQVNVPKEDPSYGKPVAPPEPPPKLPTYTDTNGTAKEEFETITVGYKYKVTIKEGEFAEKNVGRIWVDGKPTEYAAKVDKDGYTTPADVRKIKNGVFAAGEGKSVLAPVAPMGVSFIGGYSLAPMSLEVTPREAIVPPATEPPTEPTAQPTIDPTPTAAPTAAPTVAPTAAPTASPTANPTASPTANPTASPTANPTASPTASPKPSPSAPPAFKDATEPVADGVVTEKVNGKDVQKLKPDFLKTLGAKEEPITEKSKTPTYKNGWNVGRTSYYDGNGKKVTGRVVINGREYSFDNNGVLIPESRMTKGIDVSKYQPNIDWNAVKASGVEYAILRVGYRGYGSGTLVEDPLFKSHIKGATAAGLKVGVYFFSQAITAQEAVDEASMALQLVQGYNLAYPIYFDTEYVGDGARADGLSSFHRTVLARGFCETIRNSGYKAGVYASKSWFYNQLLYEDIEKYDIWVAHYNTSTDFRHRYDMWQHTSRGSCPGIPGSVDMNIAYKSY